MFILKKKKALRMFMLYSNNYIIMSHCLLFNIYIYKVTSLYNQNRLEKKNQKHVWY